MKDFLEELIAENAVHLELAKGFLVDFAHSCQDLYN